MEKKKVMIAIPYTKFIETDCWQSILNLTRPDGVEAFINTFARYSAAQARNISIKTALEQAYDYILFVDSDQIIPADTLVKLMAVDADMSVGWTPMAVNRPETNIAIYNLEYRRFDFYKQDELPKEVFEVGGCGFAVNLLKLESFKGADYPYFVFTEYPNGDLLTEDLYFCLKMKEKGLSIKCEPSLRAGHIKRIVI